MKKVIITGASGSLGKAAVEKFLDEGYKVITTVSPGKGLGFNVSTEVEIFEADLTIEKSATDVFASIITKHKQIDAALLLVGAFASGSIKDTDSAMLTKMFTLNFNTAYYLARPLFEHMLKLPDGGRLVFVGSKPGLDPHEASKSFAYGLSKSLIFYLADALNDAAGKANVTASVVVPSLIDTAVNRQSMPNADFSSWVKPEEIADAIAQICSNKSKSWRSTVLKIYGAA